MNYFNGYYPQYNNNYAPQGTISQLQMIGSIEEARAFLMPPNQTIYFLDSQNNMLYKKNSDAQCKITLTAYSLKESISKEFDFKAAITDINNKIDKLSERLDSSLGVSKNEVIENE